MHYSNISSKNTSRPKVGNRIITKASKQKLEKTFSSKKKIRGSRKRFIRTDKLTQAMKQLLSRTILSKHLFLL